MMALVAASILFLLGLESDAALYPRPNHTEHAKLARWLVHNIDWGSLSTVATDGTPSVGVVSFSDGAADNPSGRLFFYLTPMDETTQHLQDVNARCSLSISEAQLGAKTCKQTDAEDPTCARISVIGTMQKVPEGPQTDKAAQAMFSRHPAMKGWPEDHGFVFYELNIDEIHMLSWYGGMAVISREDYFGADLTSSTATAAASWQQQQRQ